MAKPSSSRRALGLASRAIRGPFFTVKRSWVTSSRGLQLWNSSKIHRWAAPIPRVGWSCSDRMHRVPKLSSFFIVFAIRSSEIASTICFTAGFNRVEGPEQRRC